MGLILVVDDDRGNRELMAQLLRDEGYAVEVAEDGGEALERLATVRPVAILLDLMMPVVDGFTFLVERRKLPECAGIPVVVVTAVQNPAELVGVMGVKASLGKPFEADELLATLREVLAEA